MTEWNRKGVVPAKAPQNLQATALWRSIQEEFLTTGDAAAVAAALTVARDEAVLLAYQAVLAPAFPKGLALLAGGAYARHQTFPYSELDLVLLLDSAKQSEAAREIMPEFVRLLWNAGLRPNSAVLSLAECVGALESASLPAFSLLDRRLLAGDAALPHQLEELLPGALATHREKLRQRLCQSARTRHAAHANTPFHSQPDLKEGPGGLQDLRLVEWLALLRPDHLEQSELSEAVSLIATVRCFLHYHAACDHNTLDFETQENLARQKFAAGRKTADWMRAYFRSAGAVFQEARRTIEQSEKSQSSLLENFREYRSRLSNQEFTVSRDHLLLRSPAQLATDPTLILRLLEFVGRHGVPPSPETERRLEAARDGFAKWCSRPQAIWSQLKTTLACPHASEALRTLQSTDLMTALFPEWGVIEHLVIADSEYRFTVGENTLRAIEHLESLGSSAPAEHQRFAVLRSEIDDVSLLLAGLLFHEMGRDGAAVGELAVERLRAIAARIGMPEEARDIVEFEILQHAALEDAIGGRDLDDPVTVRALADRVGTIERLRLLTLMTYSRIVALSDEGKIAWRLDRLWNAYGATQRELIRELETERIRQAPENIHGNGDFVKGFPLRYLRAHPPSEIEAHLQLYERSRPTGVAVRIEPQEGAYGVTIVARDKPSLFAQFAGAISSFGMDILKAEAFSNAGGVILDTFVFADPKHMLQLNPGEIDRLNDLLERIAVGRTDAHKLMRGRAVPEAGSRIQAPQIRFDSEACPTATLIEINAEDRPGLLYSLASVFSANACNIEIVLVDTKGHRAIDVFYVAQGMRQLSPEMQQRLKEKLLAAC